MISCSFNSLEANTRFKFDEAWSDQTYWKYTAHMTYEKLDDHHAIECGEGVRINNSASMGIVHVDPYHTVVPEDCWYAREEFETRRRENKK